MNKPKSNREQPPKQPPKQKPERLRIRPLEEVIPLVIRNREEVAQALGVPTNTEVEHSPDPRLAAVMATPYLTVEEFAARTANAQVILFCTFASGAMPDRFAPVMKERMAAGVPIIVISDNAGNGHGILKIIYAAGKEACDAGAFPLQKVNIMQHEEIKAALIEALNEGKKGQELVERMRELYSFKEGERMPIAEWDDPHYVPPKPKSLKDILRDSGFTDENGEYIPYRPS